ncbi:MAG: L-2-amino-thiazoline-4-carboxylic acid hydrolase [Alphaproteobacteria bacterium]|nr:L-2-amino-thiazoline-4-carboxylic acid hydrolase [Alphaproteobacteria bacterium]
MDAGKLKRELDDAFKARARLYRAILDELTAEIGAERAEAVLGRAIEKRGVAAGTALFGGLESPTAKDVADRFLAVSPAEGTLYPHTRDDRAGANGETGVTVKVHRCPLQEAWREDGASDAEIARLCRISGRFDTGCFGVGGVAFEATTWTPGSTGCCTLFLGSAAPAGKR